MNLQKRRLYSIQITGVIFKKSSQILIKEAFFCYKMCHNFKRIKAMKENISYICRPITSDDLCQIFWKGNERKAS